LTIAPIKIGHHLERERVAKGAAEVWEKSFKSKPRHPSKSFCFTIMRSLFFVMLKTEDNKPETKSDGAMIARV